MNKLEVIWELTKTDFKLKYAGSVLGFVWSLLKPLSMLGVLYLVFSFFFHNKVDNYALFLLLGIILWNYFVDSVNDSTSSILGNKNILTKTNLSPSLLILSACLHSFVSFVLNIVAFLIFFFIAGKTLTLSALFFIPLIVIMFFITTAFAQIIVILSSRFTDFRHIWDIIVQMGFWITPIVYSIEMVPLNMQKYIMLNPLAQVITYSRNAVIYSFLPSLWQIFFLLIITLILVILSVYIYNRNKVMVVDRL